MENVFIVHLRQPYNNPNEMRSDPFWEFGSFGLTGCHCKNLLHKNNYSKLKGNRLAFAQNGKEGFKMVLLTNPVDVITHGSLYEVIWNKKMKPFKYEIAPLIANNGGETDFQLLFNSILNVKRNTYVSKFSSAFRTRCYPLKEDIANEVLDVFNSKYKKSIGSNFILNYTDALPYNPNIIDKDRKNTYLRLLSESNNDIEKIKNNCRKC